MMLPSGNDASLNLAYYYGYLLGRKDRDSEGRFRDYEWKAEKQLNLEGKKKYSRIYLARFMAYMNEVIVRDRLKHNETHL